MCTVEQMICYSLWANRRVVVSLRRMTEPPGEALHLLAHVVITEAIYLERMRGEDPWPQEFWQDLSLEESWGKAKATAEGYMEFFGDPSRDLSLPVRYRNSSGEYFETALLDLATHIFLHGTYHRGQIVAIVRSAGAEPLSIDYILFVHLSNSGLPL